MLILSFHCNVVDGRIVSACAVGADVAGVRCSVDPLFAISAASCRVAGPRVRDVALAAGAAWEVAIGALKAPTGGGEAISQVVHMKTRK